MSLEECSDLHGEDYPKGKFFSALDYGRGDRTCMTIYCDYCEQSMEIKEDEFEDWIIVDPESGDKAVMCGECWRHSVQRTCGTCATSVARPKLSIQIMMVFPSALSAAHAANAFR